MKPGNSNSYLRDSFLRRSFNGYLLQQLPYGSLFLLPLTFHILVPDLIHNELGDLDKTGTSQRYTPLKPKNNGG